MYCYIVFVYDMQMVYSALLVFNAVDQWITHSKHK